MGRGYIRYPQTQALSVSDLTEAIAPHGSRQATAHAVVVGLIVQSPAGCREPSRRSPPLWPRLSSRPAQTLGSRIVAPKVAGSSPSACTNKNKSTASARDRSGRSAQRSVSSGAGIVGSDRGDDRLGR